MNLPDYPPRIIRIPTTHFPEPSPRSVFPKVVLCLLFCLLRAGNPWAIETNVVEIGHDSVYDGTVKITRDASGNMLFRDNGVTSPVSLLDLTTVPGSHAGLSGLDSDDHIHYLNEARHASAHNLPAFNDSLILSADIGGNATLGDHVADPELHLNAAADQEISGDWRFLGQTAFWDTTRFSLIRHQGIQSLGGNARGVDALDLQTSRTAAEQVASGAGSAILGGAGNVAAGTFSLAAGNFGIAEAKGAWIFTDSNPTSETNATSDSLRMVFEGGYQLDGGAALFESAPVMPALDTGQGANELYGMDQNVKTDSTVQFNRVGVGVSADSYGLNVYGDVQLGGGFGDVVINGMNPTKIEEPLIINGAVDSGYDLSIGSGGASILGTTKLGSAVVNEQGFADGDFRAEGDTETHLLFVDASEDKIGIGTDAPGELLTVVADGTSNYSEWITYASGGARNIFRLKTADGTESSPSAVDDGRLLGDIFWFGHDGTDFQTAACIAASVDGTPGTGDMPGRIDFQTTPDGSTTRQTRMTIRADGAVEMPSLAAGTGNTVYIDTSTNELYDGSSSIATKDNVATIDDALTTKLASIEPKTYTRKGNGMREYYYIAEEVAAVMPEAVNWRWEPTTATLATTSSLPLVARTQGVPEYVAQHWERALPKATLKTTTETIELPFYNMEITGWTAVPAGVNDRAVLSILHKVVKRQRTDIQTLRSEGAALRARVARLETIVQALHPTAFPGRLQD